MQTVSQPSSRDPPLCVEIFAGRASLSRALLEAGFTVLSIDHEVDSPFAPIVQLDLTTASGQAILWDVLHAPNLFAIHLGLPCGTASRARERPLSKELRDRGVPQPPPLRSATHPLGLPGLSNFHASKVDSANLLYALALHVVLFALKRDVIVSVENPATSWLWAALIALLLRDHTTSEASFYNQLVPVTFHACCHGSQRKKRTTWLSTPHVFEPLRAECQEDHEHLPFGISWHLGRWHFDTATLTGDDLDRSAIWRRKAILGKLHGEPNLEHVAHLEEACREEVDAGFLEGPFLSEVAVSERLGRTDWSLIHRFVLVQGAEMKLRPIDDCMESQMNAAYTSTSYLKLQDVDYVTGLALQVAEASSAGKQRHGSGTWMGKCLDLSKAYKQLGILPAHRHYGVIFFHDAAGNPKFYISNSLMFGATAAVYAFNRVSRSIWFLMNKMLVQPDKRR